MPMTHNALVTRLGLEIGISSQEVSDFRLDGLREQGPCPVAQNLSERIAEGPWLSQLDVSTGRGISSLWGVQFSPLGGLAISRFLDQRLRFSAVDHDA
jgi:hypothetical protein